MNNNSIMRLVTIKLLQLKISFFRALQVVLPRLSYFFRDDINLVARIISMGVLHRSYALTAGICTAGAAKIEGTIVYQVMGTRGRNDFTIRIGHPGGILSLKTVVKKEGAGLIFVEAQVERISRRLMDGYLCIPAHVFRGFIS